MIQVYPASLKPTKMYLTLRSFLLPLKDLLPEIYDFINPGTVFCYHFDCTHMFINFLRMAILEWTPAGESSNESLPYACFPGKAKEMVIASFVDLSSGSVMQLRVLCICTMKVHL